MTFFELPRLSLLFFLSSLLPGSVCSWFGCEFSESSLLGFCSDLLFLFSSGFPASTWFRCASQVQLFFLFGIFLSAFKISFSGHPFLFLGVEVWPGPFAFSPALGSVDSSLSSGKIRFSVFVWAVSCSASFFLCMWFRQNIGVSSLQRRLWGSSGCSVLGLSAGTAAPCLFHAGACGLFLCGLLGEVFVLSFFPPLAVSFLWPFLDSWLRLVSSL